MITTVPEFWAWEESWRAALREQYVLVGGCRLGYYYGTFHVYLLFVPRTQQADFDPPPATACARDPNAIAP